MLESTLKEQLKGIFAGLNANYTFDISISPAYESRQELLDLLGDVASCSDKISMQVSDGEGLEFILLKDGAKTGIKFRGVPNGHEFTSLLLAILNSVLYLQPIITQYFIDNKSEIWLLFLIAHSKR